MSKSRVADVQCANIPLSLREKSLIIMLLSVLSVFLLSMNAHAASKYAAMVVDAKSGKVLFARNADKARYPASLTKMMTLYMLFGELKKKRLQFSSELTVSAHAASRPPSKLGLKPNQKITVMNAIRALVTKSANDVAATVAENLAGTEVQFAEEMTRVAHKLGMKSTVFRNASGLPNATQRTTARDMITLSRRLYEDFPQYVYFFRTKYFAYKGKRFRNHNRLLFNYRGVEGIKTGYTRASGFNLATSYKRGKRHVYAVVMGGRTSKRRNAHMRSLLARHIRKATTKKPRLKKREPELLTPVLVKRPDVKKRKEPVIVAVKVKPVHVQDIPAPVKKTNPPVYESNRVERIQEYDDIITGPVATTKRYSARLPHEVMQEGTVSELSQGTGVTILMKNAARPVPNNVIRTNEPAVVVEEAQGAKVQEEQVQTADLLGPFHIQVGAFSNETEAQKRLKKISTKAKDLLAGHPALALPSDVKQKKVYRVRFASFTKKQAYSTCRLLKRRSIECFVLRVE